MVKDKKSKKGGPSKKIEKAMANPDPIAALDYADWQFASQLALGKTASAAARIAYPNWSEDSIKSNASVYAKRPDIVRAKLHLIEVFVESKQESIIATKNEVLAYLTGVIRTPLSEIDKESPFCLEHTHTINSNGASEKIKKVSPIDAIDKLSKLIGWLEDEGNAPRVNIGVVQLIQQASCQGVPIEATEVGNELLEGID